MFNLHGMGNIIGAGLLLIGHPRPGRAPTATGSDTFDGTWFR